MRAQVMKLDIAMMQGQQQSHISPSAASRTSWAAARPHHWASAAPWWCRRVLERLPAHPSLPLRLQVLLNSPRPKLQSN